MSYDIGNQQYIGAHQRWVFTTAIHGLDLLPLKLMLKQTLQALGSNIYMSRPQYLHDAGVV